MVPNTVKKQVVTLLALGEILLRVINYVICANGSDHVHVPGAAYTCHLSAERLSDLHGERTHTPCRAVYQDPLPRLNPPLVAKSLQCGERRDGCGSRLLKK